MRTQDFGLSERMEKERKIILKGKVYQCQGLFVISKETTCNFTKNSFEATIVGYDRWPSNDERTIGTDIQASLINFNALE